MGPPGAKESRNRQTSGAEGLINFEIKNKSYEMTKTDTACKAASGASCRRLRLSLMHHFRRLMIHPLLRA